MTTQFNRNFHGVIPFSDTCFQIAVNGLIAESISIPGDSRIQYEVIFGMSATSKFFIGLNISPIIPPVGTIADVPNVAFNPRKMYVNGGDVVYCISPNNDYMGISLYKVS